MQNQHLDKDHTHNVLDTEKVGPLLFKLATPAFFGMFVQTLYNVVNTIFIGHINDGANAIAGLSITFPIQMLMMGMGMMVGMGGTSLISRYIGSREIDKAERALGNGITGIVIISIIVTAAIIPNVNGFLRLIGASDNVLPYAREYLVIIVYGSIFNLVGMVLLNFIRAEGNARVPMIGNIMGAVINVILDWIFILVLDMGVTGAALGTVIAQTVTLIYLAYFYFSKNSFLKLRKRNLRLDLKILKPMFTIGISSFVQTAAGSISALLVIRAVALHGGDIYLSAFGIIQRVMMFATMPAMVIGQGVQPILGFNYGAKRFTLALKAFKISAVWSTVFSFAAFALLIFIPESVARIFTNNAALIGATGHASRLVFWSMPIMGFIMVGSTSFMSIGKAVQAFITALARPVLFLLPAIMILPRIWGREGVFLAFPASDAFTLILTILLLIPIFKEFRKAALTEKQMKLSAIPVKESIGTPENSRKII